MMPCWVDGRQISDSYPGSNSRLKFSEFFPVRVLRSEGMSGPSDSRYAGRPAAGNGQRL